MPERPTALILGCGYLGRQVARRLLGEGYAVTATTRSEARLDELRAEGAEGILFDLAEAATSPLLSRPFDVVLYAVAPGSGGDSQLAFHDGALAIAQRVQTGRFVYVSSIGVYAQRDGQELDETSASEPEEPRPQTIRHAERSLLASSAEGTCPAIVLRLGGLYGPGRSPIDWLDRAPMRARLEARGRAAYMNWIHIDDAADVTVLTAQRGRPGEIYLGVDGSPVRRGDFFDFAAKCGGFAPLAFSAPSAAGGEDLGKRLSHAKATRELGFQPQFPSYREGLASLVKD